MALSFSFLFLSCYKEEFDRLSVYDFGDVKTKERIPKNDEGEKIFHTYYCLSYNEEHEQANWVYYKLKKEYLIKNTKRQNDFREDNKVTTESAQLTDYKYSGFDRGHLVPSADMLFSKDANSETFFLSNMCPMTNKMNGGVWNTMEQWTRTTVGSEGDLEIYTGPIFQNADSTIGSNEVTVPKYFYKILFDEDADEIKVLAFIVPNFNSVNNPELYVTTVDEIEKQTGLDFLGFLPNKIEKSIEKEIALDDWPKLP